jgi:hypothetical protein
MGAQWSSKKLINFAAVGIHIYWTFWIRILMVPARFKEISGKKFNIYLIIYFHIFPNGHKNVQLQSGSGRIPYKINWPSGFAADPEAIFINRQH